MPSRFIVIALSVCAVLGVTSTPAMADRADCNSRLEAAYSAHYYAVAKKFNKRAPGRNIRAWGVKRGQKVRDATCHELRVSKGHLISLRRTPEPGAPLLTVRAGAPSQPPSGTLTPHPSANLPDCTWRPESGGDYGAYNSGSGARGKYQVIESTHASICPDLSWSPGDQEICAARIYAVQGPGAWVGC